MEGTPDRPLGFDVIGDVHGRKGTWSRLLERLGYTCREGRWRAPPGRCLVSVGDLVDQGPDPLGCLERMRQLVEDGQGRWVLGNHEANLLQLRAGLRPATEQNRHQAQTTLEQIESDPGRWAALEDFLLGTPLSLRLDRDRLRVVHACWDEAAIAALPPSLGADDGLRRTAEGGDASDALERCLKGPEVRGEPFRDAYGHLRTHRRSRWWRHHPPGPAVVAFGHYRFPRGGNPDTPGFLGPGGNLCCLDFDTPEGRLTALRWPEREFVQVTGRD